ncbi:hypothetical protein HYV80_01840 [Candidatus Woesearchaeota archaeon]|nr:hypothetical protein [Candidatus Woesearchaeota archaeon]
MPKCPKCGSDNAKLIRYLGIKVVKCSSCGFDESAVYEVFPEQKASQKAKGNYSKYKTGGSRRTAKRRG